jgi:hypothetical protein
MLLLLMVFCERSSVCLNTIGVTVLEQSHIDNIEYD